MLSQASVAKKITLTLLALLASVALVTSAVLIVQKDDSASAVKASDFNPGRIIDDAVFYNAGAMTAGQIQTFLNAKNPYCDTNGTGRATDWGRPDITRATLASYIRNGTHGYNKNTNFHAPPYTCLKDFKQDTPQVAAASGLCEAIPARSNRTAAQIIHDVAQACGINPQVFLVLLEKEQSLVTDIWPLNLQYQRATGFACPDNVGGACDPSFNGFFRQVYAAGRQFKLYQSRPNDYNYRAGVTNNIFWQTNGGNFVSDGRASSMRNGQCGYSRVRIENQATAALYIYTPYRPNQAAMASFPGTGDACSAYGNRNFWFMFNNWFGSTHSNLVFREMKTPRWMQTKYTTNKINPYTKDSDPRILEGGMVIYFQDIITLGGTRYLRTAHDSVNYNNLGVPIDHLEEVIVSYGDMKYPRWMETTQELYKTDPRTRSAVGDLVPKGTKLFFPTFTNFRGTQFLRTQADTHNNRSAGIPISALQPSNIDYFPLKSPRWMITTKDTKFYDLRYPTSSTSPTMPAGTAVYVSVRTNINGTSYVNNGDPTDGEYIGTHLSRLRDITSSDFRSMKHHRTYRVTEDTNKINLADGKKESSLIKSGREIYFQSLIILDGSLYLRTAKDTAEDRTTAIPIDNLEPVEVEFNPMKRPRSLTVRSTTRKVDPVTLGRIDTPQQTGKVIRFSQTTRVDGELYLRTEHDTTHNHYKAIRLSDLKEI